MLVQYRRVNGYCCMCVTVMCWCIIVGYRFIVVYVLLYCVGAVWLGIGLILCMCYCNVLVQYSWVQGYFYVCVSVMCWCSIVGYRVIVVCVLCLCSTVGYRVTVVCVLL